MDMENTTPKLLVDIPEVDIVITMGVMLIVHFFLAYKIGIWMIQQVRVMQEFGRVIDTYLQILMNYLQE